LTGSPLADNSERAANSDGEKSAPSWRRARDFLTSRWFVKWTFFAVFVAACVQLFRFAAWIQGNGPYVARPEAPAGLLPVGHFTSFFAWARGGGWDTLLPAGPVIIIGALTISFLFRRGFCGWICPVGTVWEAFSAAGRRLFGRNFTPPKWADIAGRVMRFVIAGAVVALLMSVPIAEAVDFRSLPYMWVADLKILDLMIRPAYLIVILVVGVVSALVGPIWCRYLCPVGGLYCAPAALSPCAVTRNEQTCIQCARCAKACHAYCRPDRVHTVRDTECDGCMDCVRACPVDHCLEARLVGKVRIAPWVWPLLVVGVWLAIYAGAKVSGNWDSTVPVDGFRSAIESGILTRPSLPDQQQ
jgi:polyferredoxin